MSKLSTVTAALSLVLAYAPVSQAVTFNVNRSIGAGGVTGTIDTDGTLGVLSTANFTNWNLTLNDSVGTFNLLGPLSGSNSQLLVSGSSFSATATDLLFDFSGGGFALFQNPGIGSGLNFWCLESSNCSGLGNPGESVALSYSLTQNSARSGIQSIATTAGAQSVPEPSSSLGMLVGTVGAASILKRKLKPAKSIEKELEKVS
jgi:hypothetical protein